MSTKTGQTIDNQPTAKAVGSDGGFGIKRSETWKMFEDNWCPNCGKKTEMERIHTGMPGIQAQKCPDCGTHYHANYLEDADDVLQVPANFTLPNQ